MERLHPSDLEAVSSLLEENSLLASDLQSSDMARFVGVREAGTLLAIGGIQYYGTDGLLRSIAVSSALRGEGYGKKIVSHLEQMAAADGILTLYLLTETAAAFFAKLEYETTPRPQVPDLVQATPQFAGLCPDTAVCMKKQLPPDVSLQRAD